MRARLQTFFTIAACLAPVAAVAQQDEVFYRISGDRLRCLIENAQQYLATDKDLLYIAIDACPEISDDPLLAATANVNPDIPEIVEEGVDRLLTLTKDELACIATAEVPAGAEVYEIFPESCSVRPRR